MDGAGQSDCRYPSWSRDGEHIYFQTFGPDAALYRIGIKGRKLERVVSLKDFARAFGTLGPWSGLATDDSPVVDRDASFDEIYALDWEAPGSPGPRFLKNAYLTFAISNYKSLENSSGMGVRLSRRISPAT